METHQQLTQDLILAIAYLLITCFSLWRTIIYFSPKGGGKVITLFYTTITLTAIIRSIWFFIPSNVLEGTYVPIPVIAFESNGWMGIMISEIMCAFGSLCLYAVFLLIVCYWAHMLQKVGHPTSPETSYLLDKRQAVARHPRTGRRRRGPMETFALTMLFLFCVQSLNIVLFLCRVYNSEAMILYDAVLFALTSVATLIAMTMFSSKIRVVLTTIGVINANSTRPQVRRILAITVAANMFFVMRLVIELFIAILLIVLWTEQRSFFVMVSDKYWNNYIFFKHWSEVLVLSLELLISTAIKSSQSSNTEGTQDRAVQRKARRKNKKRTLQESELLPLKSDGGVDV